ncbi:MAG: RecQ family ATP-dependent DNA helicase [Oscillospiraceae bacterium]|nr:RecQ family ATP-dependent DNA helicase [Oscillospiraceae bacterium]
MNKHEALKKYFGYTYFRSAQENIIDTLVKGRDVLGVMPTGAGKSICYQIPALLMEGATLVISPLISLMKDQVAGLRHRDIPAAFINSSLTVKQYKKVLRAIGIGAYKIIYMAPERLETADFCKFAVQTDISLIAVDEAHCVSQWGQDFRPSYLKIANFISDLKKRPVVGAFTATATADVKKDIINLLALQNPMSLTTGFDRPNLYFGVERPQNKRKRFYEIIEERGGEHGVVYCTTRAEVDKVYGELKRRGVSASCYHAGLCDITRRVNQDNFINGDITVMVATNAFGMGIDKADVRYVVHYNIPKNLESYYQEAGRAGRDGKASDCILLFSDEDIKIAEHLINYSRDNDELTAQQRDKVCRLDERRLDKMIRYCEIEGCLRSYMLNYFGEKHKGRCGNCGNCLKPTIWQSLKKGFDRNGQRANRFGQS